jgi:hypothetical protein
MLTIAQARTEKENTALPLMTLIARIFTDRRTDGARMAGREKTFLEEPEKKIKGRVLVNPTFVSAISSPRK